MKSGEQHSKQREEHIGGPEARLNLVGSRNSQRPQDSGRHCGRTGGGERDLGQVTNGLGAMGRSLGV